MSLASLPARAALKTSAIEMFIWPSQKGDVYRDHMSPFRGANANCEHRVGALALFEQGLYAETVQKLKSSSAHCQAAAGTSTLLARAYANLGNLAEARRGVEKSLAADKLHSSLHYMRAVIVQEQGATEEALLS
jgi:tetratricopeptide (TPR) repeat protein